MLYKAKLVMIQIDTFFWRGTYLFNLNLKPETYFKQIGRGATKDWGKTFDWQIPQVARLIGNK